MMKVFYVFAALALLSLAISVGGKWFGRAIALAGHTDDPALREIVIGNNVVSAPANMIRFDRQRRDGVAERLDLYLRWPELDGYSDAARDDFNHARGARRIIFLSFEERMMSRDMSGRLEPIYASMLVRPGTAGPGGTVLYRFNDKSGYLNEVLAVAAQPDGGAFVARCLVGESAGGIAGALRARHPCRRQSQPVLPFPQGTSRRLAEARRGDPRQGRVDARNRRLTARRSKPARISQSRSMSRIAIEKL